MSQPLNIITHNKRWVTLHNTLHESWKNSKWELLFSNDSEWDQQHLQNIFEEKERITTLKLLLTFANFCEFTINSTKTLVLLINLRHKSVHALRIQEMFSAPDIRFQNLCRFSTQKFLVWCRLQASCLFGMSRWNCFEVSLVRQKWALIAWNWWTSFFVKFLWTCYSFCSRPLTSVMFSFSLFQAAAMMLPRLKQTSKKSLLIPLNFGDCNS